jgi:hypothetical protein
MDNDLTGVALLNRVVREEIEKNPEDFMDTLYEIGGWPTLSMIPKMGLPHPSRVFCGRVGLPRGLRSA